MKPEAPTKRATTYMGCSEDCSLVYLCRGYRSSHGTCPQAVQDIPHQEPENLQPRSDPFCHVKVHIRKYDPCLVVLPNDAPFLRAATPKEAAYQAAFFNAWHNSTLLRQAITKVLKSIKSNAEKLDAIKFIVDNASIVEAQLASRQKPEAEEEDA